MDKWVTSTKPLPIGRVTNDDKQKQRTKLRYNPYGVNKSNEKKFDAWKDKKKFEKILAPLQTKLGKPSSSALTKRLLSTLSDESNPITHSDIYERSDHVVSLASGHQRSERRGGVNTGYLEDRNKKIADQHEMPVSEAKLLDNVRVYINGYLSDTTDIEFKRIVCLAGGRIMHTTSGATHIVTSHESLNASKTHKFLNTKSKHKVYVVKPEWVTESIKTGKRQSEREYAVIKDATAQNLFDAFKTVKSSKSIGK